MHRQRAHRGLLLFQMVHLGVYKQPSVQPKTVAAAFDGFREGPDGFCSGLTFKPRFLQNQRTISKERAFTFRLHHRFHRVSRSHSRSNAPSWDTGSSVMSSRSGFRPDRSSVICVNHWPESPQAGGGMAAGLMLYLSVLLQCTPVATRCQ